MKLERVHIIIFVVVILLVAAGWYVFRVLSSTDSCASVKPSEQAACCAELNKDQIAIDCKGNWIFDKSLQQCSFECDLDQEIRFCTQDVFECPDGSFVSRDPQKDCAFKPCS